MWCNGTCFSCLALGIPALSLALYLLPFASYIWSWFFPRETRSWSPHQAQHTSCSSHCGHACFLLFSPSAGACTSVHTRTRTLPSTKFPLRSYILNVSLLVSHLNMFSPEGSFCNKTSETYVPKNIFITTAQLSDNWDEHKI